MDEPCPRFAFAVRDVRIARAACNDEELTMRFVVMTACVAVMACLQSAPAQAQMMPWGTWETRYGSGSMFTSYGPSYYTGYAPVYYTAAYGPSYYNGGCCGISSPCSGGACGGCSSCASGCCGNYSAGYGYDCGCGTGCCDGCAGGCNGCSSCGGSGCSSCGGAGCSGGNCANCAGTSSGSNMTPTPDNSRPTGPQPTPATPLRNPEGDGFDRATTPPANTGTFDGNRPSSIPGNTPPNNTNPANNWSTPAPASNIELGPRGGTPRGPAAGEPGGGAAPAYTPPASSIPSGERFNNTNPGANTPASNEFNPGNNVPRSNEFNPGNDDSIRLNKPDTSSIHYIDGPIAHRYEARRLRSQLATASKPLKVSRVAVQDAAAPSEQIASNR